MLSSTVEPPCGRQPHLLCLKPHRDTAATAGGGGGGVVVCFLQMDWKRKAREIALS